jgi:hypothetical protein
MRASAACGSRARSGAANQIHGVVGMPAPVVSSLASTLSMATALAETPQPTYGTPAMSSRPMSAPSSP